MIVMIIFVIVIVDIVIFVVIVIIAIVFIVIFFFIWIFIMIVNIITIIIVIVIFVFIVIIINVILAVVIFVFIVNLVAILFYVINVIVVIVSFVIIMIVIVIVVIVVFIVIVTVAIVIVVTYMICADIVVFVAIITVIIHDLRRHRRCQNVRQFPKSCVPLLPAINRAPLYRLSSKRSSSIIRKGSFGYKDGAPLYRLSSKRSSSIIRKGSFGYKDGYVLQHDGPPAHSSRQNAKTISEELYVVLSREVECALKSVVEFMKINFERNHLPLLNTFLGLHVIGTDSSYNTVPSAESTTRTPKTPATLRSQSVLVRRDENSPKYLNLVSEVNYKTELIAKFQEKTRNRSDANIRDSCTEGPQLREYLDDDRSNRDCSRLRP
ncbi:hypothetical protein ANN_24408 [Periplaneta americana]|uniref:Uncharacterized protein n=1 Tax=Periplaneta americana TaxID=6978 RepID=A0ABQ8S398_PERAM|nr:hypothetical protein ANN_24408 [Periplaneta americana]